MSAEQGKYIRYPIYDRGFTTFERIAVSVKTLPFICNICGKPSLMKISDNNFREHCICSRCQSFNRQRQIAFVLCNSVTDRKYKSLDQFSRIGSHVIYNTETTGTLHSYLSKMKGYISSEYFGDEYKSGDIVKTTLHEDLSALSFEDEQFDIVISTDVFEHIADPMLAFAEVRRVLKPGGRHIFTIPFYQTAILNEERAKIQDNQIVYTMEPMYHIDPIRPDGVLVFNIFSIELIVKLAKMGFRTNMYHLYSPINGILGGNGLVFESIRMD